MSSENVVETVEVSDAGVTVVKELSQQDGTHLQVELDIISTHDAEATVDVVEAVPASTVPAQIGFMPDHEPHEWDLGDDGTLTLQARLVPEGHRQLIYGLRDIDPEEAEVLTGDPAIAALGGPAGDRVEVTQDAEGPETQPEQDSVPDDGAAEAADGAAPSTGDAPPAAGDAPDAVTLLEPPIDEEVASRLAAELEPHLDGASEPDPVMETKLDQLQEDVSEIRPYLPALEEFLGDAGRAEDIADDLAAIRSSLDDLEESIETLDEGLGETEAAMHSALDAVRERIERLEDWRGDIAAVSDAGPEPAAEDEPAADAEVEAEDEPRPESTGE